MAFLTRLFARGEFPLPQFDLAPLAFELQQEAGEDELLLDRAITAVDDRSNVVALAPASRTPGELHESIERHLRTARDGGPPLLAQGVVDELRDALAELRRSLG
ncbi:MAG TPA: hypothetical protein VNS53_03670 [Sphingomicrobium sp.]|jgi:hypothetical protein|nr:hypothetical protein [Sphingomicrobium sp.]